MSNQEIKQLIIEGSDDNQTQAIINKIKMLQRQPIGLYSKQEQQQVFDEKQRAFEQLEKLGGMENE